MARRRRTLNLGNISIGEGDSPKRVDGDPVQEKAEKEREAESKADLEEKVMKYRKEHPEMPEVKKKDLSAPLSIRRERVSFDDEYVALAKSYLKLPKRYTPTITELSKAVIRLFDDNVKLCKRIDELKRRGEGMGQKVLRSGQSGGSWN